MFPEFLVSLLSEKILSSTLQKNYIHVWTGLVLDLQTIYQTVAPSHNTTAIHELLKVFQKKSQTSFYDIKVAFLKYLSKIIQPWEKIKMNCSYKKKGWILREWRPICMFFFLDWAFYLGTLTNFWLT